MPEAPVQQQSPPSEPLCSLDLVNGEFAVGYNEHFERGWHRLEVVGRYLMAAFVLLAMAGAFGRGVLNHAVRHSADGASQVDFEPVARMALPTQVTVHLPPAQAAGTVAVFATSTLIEPLGLQDILPRPTVAEAAPGGITWRFTVEAGETVLRFMLKPTQIGRATVRMQVAGRPVRWSQWVMP